MADRGIVFEAGGREFRLHLGSWAMTRFERRMKELDPEGKGKSVLAAADELNRDPTSMSWEVLSLLWWAALEPEVSEKEAAEVWDELGFKRASEMLGENLEEVFAGLLPGQETAGKNRQRASGTKR